MDGRAVFRRLCNPQSCARRCGWAQNVVLSRRPGRVREVISLDTPLAARDEHSPALQEVERQLWQLMRDEARAAERELEG